MGLGGSLHRSAPVRAGSPELTLWISTCAAQSWI